MASASETVKPIVTFVWKIENFSYCTMQKGEFLKSPVFRVPCSQSRRVHEPLQTDECELHIYPNGNRTDTQLELYCFRPASLDELTYELSFLNADGLPILKSTRQEPLSSAKQGIGIDHFPMQKDIFITNRSTFLPQDILTVRCSIWNCKSLPMNFTESFCSIRSRTLISRRSFLWRIPNFNELQLYQSRFSVVEWSAYNPINLQLSLEGIIADEADIVIKIGKQQHAFHDGCKCLLITKLSLLDHTGKAVLFKQDKKFYNHTIEAWSFPNFLTKQQLLKRKSEYLPDNTLSLYCEFSLPRGLQTIETIISDNCSPGTILNGTNHPFNPLQETVPAPSPINLQQDLVNLYKEESLTDTTLWCGLSSFSVHKVLLSARSPVFKTIFTKIKQETASDSLQIPGIDVDTIAEMLRFIYTDTVGELKWESSKKLYFAADKYQLISLKQKCTSFLASNVCVSNVCDLFMLADKHNDNVLKQAAQQFLLNHTTEIFISNDWKIFKSQHVNLAAEIMQKIILHWEIDKK